jgi:protoporphyrinogen oxidase
MDPAKQPKTAIIIGAGPAGLTAAYEFLTRSDIRPIVLEQTTQVGGISRTVNHNGNRMDIGGHRFFSKSDRVMEWWLQHMPLEHRAAGKQKITYQQQSREIGADGTGPDPAVTDEVMLVRERKSRIYFLRTFFDYPIKLSADTLLKLGFIRTMRIGFSYMWTVVFPPREIKNLEQFFISRFGTELYNTFFKSYTEKVWGVPCNQISAEWGEQRIKGLSILKTITHILKQAIKPLRRRGGVAQKDVETSLIEQFMYPKFGPGQMWEVVTKKVTARGGAR